MRIFVFSLCMIKDQSIFGNLYLNSSFKNIIGFGISATPYKLSLESGSTITLTFLKFG